MEVEKYLEKVKRKNSADLTIEKTCVEKVYNNTLNAPFIKLQKEKKGILQENEKLKFASSSKHINIYHEEIEEETRKTLDLANIISKKRNSKGNIKDTVAEILDEFIHRFTINYTRNVIKKTIVVFNSIINRKFEEKINLFNNIHEQIASIEMMINVEMSNFNAYQINFN